MKVLYFGFYDPDYARNRVLIRGLKANGVEVIECRDRSRGLKKFVRLFSKLRSFKKDYDVVIVGFLGHTAVPFAKILISKPIVFDAFISLYDSNVFDRRLTRQKSIKAFYYWFLDWFSMKLADIVLFDTREHIDYVFKEFKIEKDRFRKIFVGTDDRIFYPREVRNIGMSKYPFTVHFHGSFIPLQGVDCIIKAAKLLENNSVRFNILGDGQTYPETKKLAADLGLKNVNFINRVEYERLPDYVNLGDVCLGIFGRTKKAGRVIPNKVYEYAAMRKPVITADTPAIRELFDDRDMLLIEPTPESLALAIRDLKKDPVLRETISENAYNKVKNFASPEVLGKELKTIVQKLL